MPQLSLDLLAQALIAELSDAAAQDRALSELEAVEQALHDPAGRRLLDPGLPLTVRSELLSAALSSHVQSPVKNVCRLLLEQGKLPALGEFITRLQRERERRGISRAAVVTTAVPLSKHESGDLRKRLEQRFDMPVTLRERLDPSLIGGLQVASGDWLFDGSVKGRLQRLARVLTS